MFENISKKIANFVKLNNSYEISDTQVEIIEYMIQVFLLNFYKATIILTISYFLHILSFVIIGILVFGITRTFAGGVHLSDTFTCLIISSLIIIIPIILALYIPYNIFIISFISLINFILLWLYSPADTEYKPLKSKKLRKKLKFHSFLIMIILYLISISLMSIYSNVIIFMVCIGCLTTTPIIYNLFKRRYNNHD